MTSTRQKPRTKRKRAANLSVDADLLAKARALGFNVSAVLEESLRAKIRDAEARRWLGENGDAIDALNKETQEHGVWSDRLRRF